MERRGARFNMRLTEQDRAALSALAALYGRSDADTVRLLISRAVVQAAAESAVAELRAERLQEVTVNVG